MKKSLFKRGFSLIEILVVLSIIGILSGALYLNFNAAQVDSKNKAFRVELKEMQLALEMYKGQHGQYPETEPTCRSTTQLIPYNLSQRSTCAPLKEIIKGLTPDFIDKIISPAQSANSACDILYYVNKNNASSYKLIAKNCYEGATSPATGITENDEFARCPTTCSPNGTCDPTSSSFYSSFAIYSPGGECWQ